MNTASIPIGLWICILTFKGTTLWCHREHYYFAMGDHRGVSLDSRYWGFIPKENVIGRPMFIYWSFETPENQYRKTEWSDRLLFLGKSGAALLR